MVPYTSYCAWSSLLLLRKGGARQSSQSGRHLLRAECVKAPQFLNVIHLYTQISTQNIRPSRQT